ncbi:PolC-type DNA polymerase III [Pendulispora albinea]|uniref:3'-5' exonuclease n=1 Tax=Pendulispora albinea TaxID=2741071 RepID=A0ABZ2LXA3_9BACT
MRVVVDGCGCFPTGRHYAGIAHLLRAVVRGLAEEFAGDGSWSEIPIAVIDVETTGRDASVDRVVEVGVVVGRHGEVIARYNWLINPGVPIPEEARQVHHISDDDVKDSPRFHEIAHEIAAALAGCIPAAYNAAFDRAFLANEFARSGPQASAGGPESKQAPALRRDVDWIDPLVWAREIHKEEKSKALGEVAQRLGIALENAHRANDDAEAALRVFYSLANDTRVPRTYGAIMQEQRRLALLQSDERRFWKN